ncbi:arginine--tRNA ligase [Sanyastnella coralliicola]|uniref:arginine--tRNA ligase n=1 Tax=Sanyastnella coralliicola TaxID=3069118 RepID=UPI0027BA0F14|nr:arginine--tRNA ligase [Longitalea sp. SCSIO 12813]
MKSLDSILSAAVVDAAKDLFGAEPEAQHIQLQKTRKDFEGDVTLVVFPLVRLAKTSPEKAGTMIGEWLVANTPEVEGFNVVKGFLNLVVSEAYWKGFLKDAFAQEHFGYAPKGSRGQVMVEYSSPNTNKPLHLGHLRNNFLGYSVAKILEANGHDVVKVQIINDRGIHICKSMVAWEKFGEGETPESSGLKGDKLVGKYYVMFDQHYKQEIKDLIEQGKSEEEAKAEAPILLEAQEMLRKWEQKDPEVTALWEKMNSWVYSGFDVTYHEMGVSFDKLYYESNTYLTGKDEVMRGVEEGFFYKRDDGSVWVDLTDDGLDEKLVLRKDGTAVYMTQDIGTAILRFNEFPELKYQIYTVGNEQEYHFKVLFLILGKLGFENAKDNFHLSYGMVELPEGKMKSREGTVVDADDLLAEMAATAQEIAEEQGKLDGISEEERAGLYKKIGYGALKYYLLKVDPKKKMMFDPKESIDFFGNTGPFIQFNYVRTLALLRKAAEAGISASIADDVEIASAERALIRKIYEFPGVLEDAAKSYDPSQIANYVYDLVKEYSSFYQTSPILKEENDDLRSLRLAISQQTGEVIRDGMNLLGVDMPERM